ncbi:MAG: phage Gp37/Gp68 family protein [Chloroflexota bacterium]|nr:phage Gp37/Gp68 family protein [Chloroflexota bacterium]
MPSKIEWTEETWNPVTGCTKVSAGCQNCYAERMSRRLAGRYGYPLAPDHFNVTLHPDRLDQPEHWRKPRKVFVCSMGDLFHEDVPDDFIDQVFMRIIWNGPAYLNQTEEDPEGTFWPGHIFQILTKRPERMQDVVERWHRMLGNAGGPLGNMQLWYQDEYGHRIPHLWLGVTAENQDAADERIPWLFKTPAAIRFVSVEPMLGPVLLDNGVSSWLTCYGPDPLRYGEECCELFSVTGQHFHGIDWVICGGETGPGARPMAWHWAESLHQQCLRAGVPFFFKHAGDAFEGNPELLPSGARQWPKAVTNDLP